ncbi:MAG: hypothetical protein OIN86_06735 [Candidatus Methanoperedens sp.]|nr:hypothetical protein [Candidatus Methanoperedens sp.]CAG0956212.1 hypothetical protein METP1_00461 [Methanosarcinales archaeon]
MKEIDKKFYKVVAWIKKNNTYNMAKAGWGISKRIYSEQIYNDLFKNLFW